MRRAGSLPEYVSRLSAGVKWLRVVEAAPYGLAPLSGSIKTSASSATPRAAASARWPDGPMARWPDGPMARWPDGPMARWPDGPMARTYGLASDRVRAIEVVTGDGELRRATPTEHPDLFFGLRGGKGALGVVTAIESARDVDRAGIACRTPPSTPPSPPPRTTTGPLARLRRAIRTYDPQGVIAIGRAVAP